VARASLKATPGLANARLWADLGPNDTVLEGKQWIVLPAVAAWPSRIDLANALQI
jgi:hypothetical protein